MIVRHHTVVAFSFNCAVFCLCFIHWARGVLVVARPMLFVVKDNQGNGPGQSGSKYLCSFGIPFFVRLVVYMGFARMQA
jgi:hypothetical protein